MLTVAIALGGTQAFAQTATTTSSAQVNAFLAQLTILRQLGQGMSGEDVKILQGVLAAQPDIYPEGIVSGYYGPLTSKAVRKYQEKFGIDPVGRVGPITMRKLNEIIVFNASATSTATTTAQGGCVRVPPGHLVAPGWIKKNGGVAPQAAPCQKLPPGIAKKLGQHNGTSTATTTPPTDSAAPVITGIAVSTTTATTSQVVWITNELATTKLVYGTSSPILSSVASTTVTVSGLSLVHAVNLANLSTSTTYYFAVMSADNAGNAATSSQVSFSTLAQ